MGPYKAVWGLSGPHDIGPDRARWPHAPGCGTQMSCHLGWARTWNDLYSTHVLLLSWRHTCKILVGARALEIALGALGSPFWKTLAPGVPILENSGPGSLSGKHPKLC